MLIVFIDISLCILCLSYTPNMFIIADQFIFVHNYSSHLLYMFKYDSVFFPHLFCHVCFHLLCRSSLSVFIVIIHQVFCIFLLLFIWMSITLLSCIFPCSSFPRLVILNFLRFYPLSSNEFGQFGNGIVKGFIINHCRQSKKRSHSAVIFNISHILLVDFHLAAIIGSLD